MMDIKLRNFIVLFVSISLLVFLNYQINQKHQQRKNIQHLVHNIFKNETDYELNQYLELHLEKKLKANMSASYCLARLYLNVLQGQSKQEGVSQNIIKLHENMDWLNIKTCGDVISLMHHEHPKQTQTQYMTYLSEKYGSNFDDNSTSSYCILINQFNNSLTTLKKSIRSILNQEYQNFKLIVIDNDSGDGSYQISKVFLQQWKQDQVLNSKGTLKIQDLNKKYRLIKSKKHLSQLNILETYIPQCGNSQYIVLLDGRDQLLGEYTFQIMNIAIKNTKYELITASVLSADSFSKYSQVNTLQRPYHFKAFSQKLWKMVKEEINGLKIQQNDNDKEISTLIVNKMMQIAGQDKQSGLLATIKIDQILSVFHQIGPDRNRYLINKAKPSKKQNQTKENSEASPEKEKAN